MLQAVETHHLLKPTKCGDKSSTLYLSHERSPPAGLHQERDDRQKEAALILLSGVWMSGERLPQARLGQDGCRGGSGAGWVSMMGSLD